MASSQARKKVVIKKYANRRLYHTGLSKHVTLDDLAQIVREGNTVKVVDANTDADLTRQVLTLVMLEQQTPLALLPVELLHAVIRYHGTDHQGAFAAFLAMVMKQFSAMSGLWERQIAMLLEGVNDAAEGTVDPELIDPGGAYAAAEALNPLADLRLPASLGLGGEADPQRETGDAGEPGPEPPEGEMPAGPPEADPGEPEDALDQARHRLDALLGRLRSAEHK